MVVLLAYLGHLVLHELDGSGKDGVYGNKLKSNLILII